MSRPETETSGESSFLEDFSIQCAALSADAPSRANEDRYLFAAPGLPAAERAGVGYVLVVADGMSQGGKGAFAAQKTVDVIREILLEERAAKLQPSLLELKFFASNDAVVEQTGGGCAATGIWIWEDTTGEEPHLRGGWAHAGDTRLYLKRNDKWQILTTDHAKGSALSKFVGIGTGFIPQVGTLDLEPGDWMVLCSDGVWGYACPIKSRAAEECETPEEAATQLVHLARRNASPDDATAIVIRVGKA